MAQQFEIPSKLESALAYVNEVGNPITQEAAFAIISGYVEEDGFDINRLDMTGKNLFHRAVMSGKPDVVKYMLEHGADTSISPRYGSLEDMLQCFEDAGCKAEIAALLNLGPNAGQPEVQIQDGPPEAMGQGGLGAFEDDGIVPA